MLFGIIILVVAVAVAILLNKSKITKVVHQVEDKLEPIATEVQEVVKKAAVEAPKNEVIKEVKATVETVAPVVKPKTKKTGTKKKAVK